VVPEEDCALSQAEVSRRVEFEVHRGQHLRLELEQLFPLEGALRNDGQDAFPGLGGEHQAGDHQGLELLGLHSALLQEVEVDVGAG
jgi:hypothetical protein